ncbi:MAG: hypothetical protein R3362_00285, partial [Rhodothermales bacterium]|nr:hypothetical protein [Rhodothermales bacterium]
PAEAQYTLRLSAISAGTGTATGGTYSLRSDVAVGPVGTSTGGSYELCAGFTCTYVGLRGPLQLLLDLTAYLQGAYAGGSPPMTTDLAAGGYLPSAQPFAAKGYGGTETAAPGVFTGPNPPVDWVLLRLRATPDGATVASRAALLLGDGRVVDVDGASLVAFVDVTAGAYHAVVEAQNHLAVMSAAAVDLSSGSASYDFTTALSQAYAGSGGSAAMREVAPGAWALWAGDADGDGQVTAPDFNAWSAATAAGKTGYEASDFDLNGQVTAPDFNLWSQATAAGAQTAVPPAAGGSPVQQER